ncbi:hypothetical protein C0Q70_02174 [Pomacea canaliculata]|uniref:Uncharacterized protein n=1 Tax=Pomacea canaliculata TaxID=400727 RepID=A0A2T7Q1J3_POMCA|nr:hypothetical protein C0Q70_02174 [Pomacea canaliculata]
MPDPHSHEVAGADSGVGRSKHVGSCYRRTRLACHQFRDDAGPPLLTTVMSVLGPIAAALLNVVTSLVGSLLGSLLGTALAVVQGLLALVLGIVSKLVNCVTAALNIPVGNIVQSILGAVTSAVSTITSNLTVQFLTRWDDRNFETSHEAFKLLQQPTGRGMCETQ